MTQSEKKEIESIVLDLFRRSYVHFPKGKIIQSESPDFILKINPKKSIGIELTEYHNQAGVNTQKIINRIYKLIQKKEEKIYLYNRKEINKLWLIISIDTILPDVFDIIDFESFKHKLNTQFHKIFFFELFHKRLVELK